MKPQKGEACIFVVPSIHLVARIKSTVFTTAVFLYKTVITEPLLVCLQQAIGPRHIVIQFDKTFGYLALSTSNIILPDLGIT